MYCIYITKPRPATPFVNPMSNVSLSLFSDCSYDARSGADAAGGRRWSDDFNGFGARAFFQVRPSVTPARTRDPTPGANTQPTTACATPGHASLQKKLPERVRV